MAQGRRPKKAVLSAKRQARLQKTPKGLPSMMIFATDSELNTLRKKGKGKVKKAADNEFLAMVPSPRTKPKAPKRKTK